MEGTELGSLMLSTCIVGTLLYSTDSPLNYLELSRGFTSVLMGTAIAVTTFLIIRSPFGRRSGVSFQSGGNARVSVAKTSRPLGCSLLRRGSFRWRSSGRGGRARDPRRAPVFRSSAIPCHYPWNIWETHGVYNRVCLVGTSHGHRAIRIESSALSSLQSDIGSAAYRFLFCILLFDLRIQRQSGQNFFARFVRVDMAGHLDLFLRALPGNVDVRGNIHKADGIESRVLCKNIS